MFIDGIKAVPIDSTETKIWRFRYDQGQHRNLCVILAHPSEQDLLRAAIRFGLFGVRDPRLKAALVQLTDNNGESWVFERQAEQFRCFRGRQLFDGRLDVCLKELFKDYLPQQATDAVVSQACLREYDLSFDGAALIALPSAGQQLRSSPWERAGAQRLEANRKALASGLGSPHILSRNQLIELLPFGESLMKRQHALQLQAREVDKTFHQLNRIDAQLVARLEQEVALINKIAQLAEPMLDPAKSPRVMQDRLQEIELQLQDLCEKSQVQSLPLPEIEIEWMQILQALTRYLASEKLEKAARQSLHEAKNQIKPVYEEYRSSVCRFLQYDRNLIHELETCLNELGEQVRLAGLEQDKQRDNIASRLNKLLGLGHLDHDKGRAESNFGPHSLDLSRAAVNQCLHNLGRLYSELEENQGEHDSKLMELEQRYEKIQIEHGKAREHWQQISRQCNLAPDIGVRGLVNWINQHGQITILHQRRLKTQEEIQDYRQQLKTLAQLVEDWRTHTGSQKSTKLEHAPVILAEARAVLQYAEKKRAQLLKLQAITSKFEAYQQIRSKIDQDLALVQHRWREALETWSLPLQSLETASWEKTAQLGRELLLLEDLFQESTKPLKNEQVFAAEALDAPLSFYFWKDAPQGNKARLQILQQVEHADDAGLVMIFTEDKLLAEMLLKLGLGRGQTQEPKPENLPSIAAPSTKPLMSDKARAALEVFANKQGGTPRSSI